MKKQLLLIAFIFGVLVVGCENLLPNEQTPTPNHVFVTDGEGAYILEPDGGEVVVTIATNVDYSIVIPEEAQAWLSVAETRTDSRMETQTFIIAKNDSFETRLANVEFVDGGGEVLKTLLFTQKAALPDPSCPSNEIWYTNGSTTEPTEPREEDAFGVNIISNTFDAEKERWVIEFDGDVTTIGDEAFEYCSSLTSVTIPDSVTTIGNGAFAWCSSLISITIPDSVTTIARYAFYECDSLTSVTIPDSVTTIGAHTFEGCSSLTSVTIGDSVTTIGWSAFRICISLTSVTIGDSVTTIGDYAFEDCSSLTSVTIGDSVTTIGWSAFIGCSSLTSVTIPDSVTTIESGVFSGCSSLRSVTIGDGVTTIGGSAFASCSSLTSVTIPDSVTTIGYYAFIGCSSLTSVYCKAVTPPAGGYYMFDDNASGRKIYVPTESVEAYKSAEYWNDYADAIEGYDF